MPHPMMGPTKQPQVLKLVTTTVSARFHVIDFEIPAPEASTPRTRVDEGTLPAIAMPNQPPN
jgi:hypothetical protein